MHTKKIWFVMNLLCFFVMFQPAGNVRADEKLELWVHPYLTAVELVKKFSPLATYLGEKTGQSVEVRISADYRSHMERVGEGRMDLAYLGPAPYVKIRQQYGAQTLLACLEVNGSPFFHGMIVTRQDSQIHTLHDLLGKKFAFGDPNSTMSHLVPQYMLGQAGVPLEKLAQHAFLGSHNDVALGVLGGYYDAGGVKAGVYDKYKDRGLRMLAKSPPIAEHLFVANNKLSEKTVHVIRRALLNLKDETILKAIKPTVTGMTDVQDEDYETLRAILNSSNERNPKQP